MPVPGPQRALEIALDVLGPEARDRAPDVAHLGTRWCTVEGQLGDGDGDGGTVPFLFRLPLHTTCHRHEREALEERQERGVRDGEGQSVLAGGRDLELHAQGFFTLRRVRLDPPRPRDPRPGGLDGKGPESLPPLRVEGPQACTDAEAQQRPLIHHDTGAPLPGGEAPQPQAPYQQPPGVPPQGPPPQSPYQAPASNLGGPQGFGAPLGPHPHSVQLFAQTKPWVLMFAILGSISPAITILMGVLALGAGAEGMGVGIMTILLGVIYFLPAYRLYQYNSAIYRLKISPNQHALDEAINTQRCFWKTVGIITLVAIIIGIVGFIIIINIAANATPNDLESILNS